MTQRKQIDLTQSVHDICAAYPEVKEILAELGFEDITKPGMLQTAGRFMTIPKGACVKGIDMALIARKLRERGIDVKEGAEI